MESTEAGSWQFGLWSSLALEMLARAVVSHISPTLLGDRRNWRNVHYAFGHPPTNKDFKPASIHATEAFAILLEIAPEFTKELYGFCLKHCNSRNAELHTGEDVLYLITALFLLDKCWRNM